MLNPDGKVWVNEFGVEMYKTGIVLNSEAANRIIRLIATEAGMEITPDKPSLAAKLPHWGARVQASIPPYSVDEADVQFPLACASHLHAGRVCWAGDHDRGTGRDPETGRAGQTEYSGGRWYGLSKTTLVNALLHEIAGSNDRVVLIEDSLELQCPVENLVRKLVNPPELTLSRQYSTR